MKLVERDYSRYFPVFLLLVSLVALLLLGVSYFVKVRIIIENPSYGDVTNTIQALWRATLGVTTIGSFLIGVYTLVGERDSSNSPPTKVEIKGTGHDIDVYPSGPVGKPDGEDENETIAETEDDVPSVSSDERVESSQEEERAID